MKRVTFLLASLALFLLALSIGDHPLSWPQIAYALMATRSRHPVHTDRS